MKKIILSLAACGLIITNLFAQNLFQTSMTQPKLGPNKTPIACDTFLKNVLIEDQLYEVFGEHASFDVNKNTSQNFCTLTINTMDGKTYQFSSMNRENFVYRDKTLALYLYDLNHPKIKNTIEADYEFNQILDVATDFPTMK